MRKLRLGVSEVVASMLILLIVVSIGTMLYMYLYSQVIWNRQIVSQELTEEELRTQEQLSILLVVGNHTTNTITVIVASGPSPVTIQAIYVNNTLASSEEITLDSYSVVELGPINSPIPLTSGARIFVRIAYRGGYADSWGEVA